MRARRSITLIAGWLTVAVLIAPITAGGHSQNGECPDYVQYVPDDSETATYPVYVTVDEWVHGMWSIWFYAESNGERGLQRDDDYCHHVDRDGEPYTATTADTIIY